MGVVVVGELDVSQESTIPDSQGTVVNPEDRSNNSSMLTDTPEQLRVPIATDPAGATRMTVEKLSQKQKKQRASQLKAAQAASQVSMTEAFKRMTQHPQLRAPVIHGTSVMYITEDK